MKKQQVAVLREIDLDDAIFRHLSAGICIISQDWHIQWCNQGLARVLAAGPGDFASLIGRPIQDFIHGHAEYQRWCQVLEQHKPHNTLDIPRLGMSRSSGEPLWCRVSISRASASADTHSYLLLITDITTQTKREFASSKERLLLNGLFDRNPLAISLWDMEGYNFRFNQAYVDMFGVPPSPDYCLFSDAALVREHFTDALEQIRSGRPVQIHDLHYRYHDACDSSGGRPLYLNVVGFPVFNAEGSPETIVLIHKDVTPRKRAQQQRESLQLLSQKLASVRHFREIGPIIAEQCRSFFCHDRFVFCGCDHYDSTLYGIFADAADDVAIETPRERVPLSDPSATALLNHARSLEQPKDKNAREGIKLPFVSDAARSVIAAPVMWNDKALGLLIVESRKAHLFKDEEAKLLATFADQCASAMARIRSGEAQEKTEAEYRAVVEDQTEFIARFSLEGRISFANAALCKLIGTTREQLVGNDFFTLIDPDDRVAMRTHFLSLSPDAPIVSHDIRILTGNEAPAWVNATFRALFNHLHKPVGFQVVARDISERLHAEAEMRQTQKMEAVGLLAGSVAHDFNNVLQVVLGWSQMLLLRLPEENENREQVSSILRAAKRGTRLAKQLLAVSREQTFHPQLLDINTLAVDFEEILQRMAGDSVMLQVVTAGEPAVIYADHGRVEQILMNLVVNARDAVAALGPEGYVRVSVTIEQVPCDPARETPGGEYVVLRVQDNGCGMTPETRERIFDPFFSTKGRDKGTGLGLSIVYRVVRESRGFLQVDSTPGVGTTFTVCFPRIAGTPESADTNSAMMRPVSGNETILLVEDEDDVRKLASTILHMLGYTVIEASSAEHALLLAPSHHGPIHLLVSGVILPGMDGHTLSDHLKAVRPEMRVLLMSGMADNSVVQDIIDNRKAPFLQKPFSAMRLGWKVREVLDNKPTLPA